MNDDTSRGTEDPETAPSDATTANPQKEGRRRLLTRRNFLRATGAVVGAGVVGTGGFLVYNRYQRFGRIAEHVVPDHRVNLPAAYPRMVVTRGLNPALNVRAAIERLGGIRQFISPSDVVVVKPNIGFDRRPEQAATTHPEVVAEVVRLCREVGPERLIVTDCPTGRSGRAFELSGILDSARTAGAEVIHPEDSRHLTVQLSERLGTWDVLEPFVIATKIINVPIAKHHSSASVTAGMKNWIGITTKTRPMFHTSLQQTIAELAALMRPTLTVVDASRVMTRDGPRGGSLDYVRPVNMVAAGVDPVALDAWACQLLNLSGDDIPEALHIAERMGLGQIDLEALQPLEIAVD